MLAGLKFCSGCCAGKSLQKGVEAMRPMLSHQVRDDGRDDGQGGPTGVVTRANEGHETEDSEGIPSTYAVGGPQTAALNGGV